MCRLITYIGTPLSPGHLVFSGSHSLYEQSWAPRELLSGSVNADGYGVAWYAKERPVRVAEARPIWHDDELSTLLSSVQSGLVVAALRNGTRGIPIDRSGLLPLVYDEWCFVLNGFVPDFHASHMRALREELPDEVYAALRGSSDSETLFLMAIAAVLEGATMTDALSATARRVRERVGKAEAQLNMVMMDGRSIAAVRSSTVRATNSLYLAEHPSFAPGGVVIASEAPEKGADWIPVDAHSWIEIATDGTTRAGPLCLD